VRHPAAGDRVSEMPPRAVAASARWAVAKSPWQVDARMLMIASEPRSSSKSGGVEQAYDFDLLLILPRMVIVRD
jgi:hypothetical protein